LGDIRHNFADLKKIQSQLGFKPGVNFEDGLTKFTGWVKQQDVQESKFQDSIEEMKQKGLFK